MPFNVEKLAKEVETIYNDLMSLQTPDGNRRLLDPNNVNFYRQPGWLQFLGIKVRDSVLETYGKDEVKGAVCKLSAVYTSHTSTLDVDHFFPDHFIQQRLDELEIEKETVKSLKETLKNKGSIPEKLIDQLINIPDRSTRSRIEANPDILGLRTLYYNACSNIWPMAGTFNSGKGDRKNSFEEAASIMLNSIISLYGESHFRDIFLLKLQEKDTYKGLKKEDFTTKRLDLLVEDISNNTSLKLSEGLDKDSTIFPAFSDGKTMLGKFLDSELIAIVNTYREQQKDLMNSALRNVSYINPYNISLAESLAFRKVNRALIKGMAMASNPDSAGTTRVRESGVSSKDLESDQLPAAFKMLGIIFESLKRGYEPEEESQFATQVLNTLENCIQDPELKGAISAASATMTTTLLTTPSPLKRKRSDDESPRKRTGSPSYLA